MVENKRVNGKVKQETIAVLGSIEATWLPEFWEGIDREAAAKLKAEDWELRSLQWRTAFWEGANQRLKRLTNRLGPEIKRIRMAAHARVPWPKEPERKKLELLAPHPHNPPTPPPPSPHPHAPSNGSDQSPPPPQSPPQS